MAFEVNTPASPAQQDGMEDPGEIYSDSESVFAFPVKNQRARRICNCNSKGRYTANTHS
jgi:hypothetical protein